MSGAIEIFLQPGEWYFGDCNTRIRTILGSCVSLVLWHPVLRYGGMCHYMLPRRGRDFSGELDGRYGDEALTLLLIEIAHLGVPAHEFRVRIFGGADMFPGVRDPLGKRIGRDNVALARQMVANHGLACVASHVEGIGHRNLVFDVRSGRVTLKRSLLPGDKGL